MNTHPETLWNALASVPARAPEDTLLKNFRATLEDGWDKFDKAVPPAGKTGFLRSEDYVLVKQEYESAKKMLNEIKNDDDLRANIPMRQKLDETIKMLRKHNAESDKNEWYNKALVEMERNLAKLQQDVEMNNTVLPPVTVAAVWWAIATGAIDTMNQSMRDSAKSLETEINTIKKNPIKKIAEFFGFTETSIIADYKEALAEKKAGGFDGVFAGLKIWFYGFLAKLTGTDIAKSLSPEERKLAGFREPVESQKLEPQAEWKTENLKEDISFKAWYKGFVRMYYWSLEGTQKWLKVPDLDAPFLYAPFQSMTFSWATTLFEKYNGKDLKWLLEEPECKGITNAWPAFAVLALFVSGDGSKFLRKRYGESIQNMTIRDIIAGIKDTFDIAENIHDIEINGIKDITGFMGKIGEKMDISFDNWKINEEWLKIKAEKLWITDPKLMSFVFIEAAKMPIWKFNTTDSIDKLQSIDDKGKGKLKEILKFGKDIIPVLTANCSLGEKSKYEAEFGKISPTLEDITKMYITLGWKTDFSIMSEPEQLYCYQRTWHFLWNTEFRWEYFDQPMLRAISEADSQIIPPSIRRAIGSLISIAASTTFEKMKWVAREIYGAMKWYHIAAAGAVLAAYLTYWKKIVWVWQWIAMASLVMIVSDILSKFGSPGSDGKYTLPSGTKLTKEEWAEALLKWAGATL